VIAGGEARSAVLEGLSRELERKSVTEAHGLGRYLLLRGCRDTLDRIPHLPIGRRVQGMMFDACAAIARPPSHLEPAFQVGQYPFVALSKIATLNRFPAGPFDWELSGVSRSYLLKARRRDLPALLMCVASRLRGMRPLFMPHMSVLRGNLLALLQREVYRSLYRIASAMRLQPNIRGFIATAWFYAPETYQISPHLAFLRATIVENGGFATTIGPLRHAQDAVMMSLRRKEAFEAGSFRPIEGLVIWPRADMLRWAENHPEFDA
jgi:hypothetical protein